MCEGGSPEEVCAAREERDGMPCNFEEHYSNGVTTRSFTHKLTVPACFEYAQKHQGWGSGKNFNQLFAGCLFNVLGTLASGLSNMFVSDNS